MIRTLLLLLLTIADAKRVQKQRRQLAPKEEQLPQKLDYDGTMPSSFAKDQWTTLHMMPGNAEEEEEGVIGSTSKESSLVERQPGKVLTAANYSTEVGWLFLIPGMSTTLTDKIPGAGRCVGAVIRLSNQIMADPETTFQSMLGEDSTEAWKEIKTTRGGDSVDEMKVASERCKVCEAPCQANVDKDMWMDAYLKRRVLWDLVSQLASVTPPLPANSADFSALSLTQLLVDRGVVLCERWNDFHKRIMDVDEALQKILKEIESGPLDPENPDLRLDAKSLTAWRPTKSRCKRNALQLSFQQFDTWRASIVQSNIQKAIRKGEASRQARKTLIGQISELLSSTEGQLALATVHLAKSIILPLVTGGMKGVWSPCEFLHRASDFTDAFSSQSVGRVCAKANYALDAVFPKKED